MGTKQYWRNKVKIWELHYLKETPIDRIRQELATGLEGVAPSWNTVNQVVKKFPSLTQAQVQQLPDVLQERWRELQSEAGQEVPKEATPEPRLMEHVNELAKIADILAHHGQRLIRYNNYDDIEARGDVLGHLSFWRKSNGKKVTEGTDPIEEFRYEEQHPVDPYVASWLYTHYDHKFGKPPFGGWNQMSTLNISPEIVDNLKLLAHGGLKPCPNCPICKEMIY